MDVDHPNMDSDSTVKCCDCERSCSPIKDGFFSGNMLRSVKRKLDESEGGNNQFLIPSVVLPVNARIEMENECALLREMVTNQQQIIQDLSRELDEERNASSSAANEAMSMILRLQREKAEIQMEARQFKRFAEEKMAHDQQEVLVLEDLLYKREQAIESLTCEVQMYKHRMLSYGLTEAEADGENRRNGRMTRNNSTAGYSDGHYEYDYPSLKCNSNENQAYPDADNEIVDVEKYAFDDTPRSRDQLKDLEYRIHQLEKSPRSNQPVGECYVTENVPEKAIVGHSPRTSHDSPSSCFGTTGREMGAPDSTRGSPKFSGSFRKADYSEQVNYTNTRVDNISEAGDDMSDRVYTIDSVHQGATAYNGMREPKDSIGIDDDYTATPRDSLANTNIGDPDIQKLYTRLHALEADRESMRQAIINMRTDKAQLVLLKEIAQQLCKEMSQARRPPVRKQSLVRSFSIMSVFKWISSFVFWRRKARRCKYMYGLSSSNAGLLMLLDKGPRVGQWRCLSSTQV